jgi:hypothetical protein
VESELEVAAAASSLVEQEAAGERHAGFGLLLILSGTFFLLFAPGRSAIPLSPGDPGPGFVPITGGWILVAGGVAELLRAWRRAPFRTPPSGEAGVERAAANRRTIFLLAGIAAYLGGGYAAGFTPATLVFVTALLWSLGARWWVAAAIAVTEVVVVKLLFTRLFGVPLPERLSQWIG